MMMSKCQFCSPNVTVDWFLLHILHVSDSNVDPKYGSPRRYFS